MSNNSKTKQAFPGRTGMGYESGLSKLEWITVNLISGALADPDMTLDEKYIPIYVNFAKQIIVACEAAEKAGQ